MEDIRSFVFYRSFYESAKHLGEQDRLKVYDALMEYALNGVEIELDGAAMALFLAFKPQIDANNKRRANGKTGAEFGILGGRPSNDNPNETPDKPQDNPEETPNVNLNVNANVNLNNNANIDNTHPNPPKGGREELFDSLTVPDNAKQAHEAVIERLESYGYVCEREYAVKNRGDGKAGRIDILARNETHIMAIEIDRLTPRDKSVFKLRQVPNAERIILLRGGISNEYIGDIQVISIGHSQSGNENLNDLKQELNQIFVTQTADFTDNLRNKVKEWIEYKRTEKGDNYKPIALKSLLTEIDNNRKKHGEAAVIEVISHSMANLWKGIAWNKLEKSNGLVQNGVSNGKNTGFDVNEFFNKAVTKSMKLENTGG